MMKQLFARLLAPLGTGAFIALLLLERRHPLRRTKENANRRLVRNATLSAFTGAAIQLVFLPAMTATARTVARRRIGLLQQIPLPETARTALAVILLDYTYYWWHRSLHQIPLLWRFHIVHHADRDMDVSTAIRFHFGEWLLSTPFRLVQTLLVGASERGVAAFEISMVLAIFFHHSNLRLPFAAERRLARWIVTPRLHGIHHSVIHEENSSNFSTLSALWDRLHGTLRPDVPQQGIDIGLPGYRNKDDVTLGTMLALPFRPDAPVPYAGEHPLLSFVPLPEDPSPKKELVA